jgi:rod shape-determining protein MreC
MVLDQRFDWLERAHYLMQAATYPIERAVSSPLAAWRWTQQSFATRDALEAENQRLRNRLRGLELRSMRYDALAQENAALIGLRDALPPVARRWLPAEIVNIQLDSLRQRVLIDRGSVNGVVAGQAVLDDHGVVGQTMHVGPWSAEVILIPDPEHALPVQVQRTGLRTITVGVGNSSSLALPYLPANADIRVGDVLVTSGLGGVFPPGYPVAKVTAVHKDAVQPLAHVRAAPFAHLDTDSEVMLIWFRHDTPAAPLKEKHGELTTGNRDIQPLPVRVKARSSETRKPTAPAAREAAKRPADTQPSVPKQASPSHAKPPKPPATKKAGPLAFQGGEPPGPDILSGRSPPESARPT